MLALILTLFLLHSTPVFAVSEFTLNQKITYTFDDNGNASVNHRIDLTNNFSQVYATNYQLKLSSSNLSQITASDNLGSILSKAEASANETIIDLKFNQPALGKGKTNTFNLNYRINNLALPKGNTWEISLPETKSLSSQDNLEINLDLPTSYGNISFNSVPLNQVTRFNNRNQIQIIEKNTPSKILLIFGSYQIFDFDLDYYLNNPSSESKTFDIAVPPDTEYQTIIFKSFNPPFTKIYSDQDGNWLLRYTVPASQSLAVKVSGQAKISTQNPDFVSTPPRPELLSENNYWPVTNSTIKSLSSNLVSPRDIYDYTVNSLTYDYSAINSAKRKGALEALLQPSSSLCTEFTDLFVTLSRSKGIPAREIEGYAYTNNPKIKPINLNADILHAWPQYYDKTKNTWVSVDPTWAKTTNGINYFSDLDLNHLTFVIHGSNSQEPLPPGSYKGGQNIKTVNVRFSDSNFTPTATAPEIKFVSSKPGIKPVLLIFNPNYHSLNHIKVSSSQLGWVSEEFNLLPLESKEINPPQPSLLKSAFPNNSKINFLISYGRYSPNPVTTIVKYPPHYFGLLILIGLSILGLTVGGIILTATLPKKHS